VTEDNSPSESDPICQRLSISPEMLSVVTLQVVKGSAYTTFKIPKARGGFRVIHSPRWDLGLVQRRIKERILDLSPSLPDCVTAFRKGVSIRDNALVHCNRAVVVKFDLQDFFPSVSFTRVIAIFKSFGIGDEEARSLANLTTVHLDETMNPYTRKSISSSSDKFHLQKNYLDGFTQMAEAAKDGGTLLLNAASNFDYLPDASLRSIEGECEAFEAEVRNGGSDILRKIDAVEMMVHPKSLRRRGLPQGASTSPQLANLAACKLDLRLRGLANSFGFSYTRYADDLTFSSSDTMAKVDTLALVVRQIVNDCGFRLNSSKTKIMRAPSTRRVTGLIVNSESPRVPRSMIRKIRAMLHRKASGTLDDDDIERLRGYLGFVRMIDQAQADAITSGGVEE
jgi:hypothetical protein